jgi:pimeloyl-ACP methyl ester carboxylesterase
VDERWVDFDGKRLFIRGWGDPEGNPILYWHGVHIAGRASMAINEAGPIFAGERGLRVLALDAPGFGNSQALEPSAYHPYALADLVPRLLDALGRNKTDWEAEIEQSWDALLAKVRFRYRRWNHAIESSVRAGRLEQRGRIVPSGDPLVLAAVQRGIALARPSTIRADLADGGLPVLLVASDDAAEEDLARFSAEVPQAEIYRPGGVGHDVLIDGGPRVIAFVADWLRAKGAS